MKGFTTLAISATLLSSCTGAIQLQKRTDGPARVVGFQIERNTIQNPVKRDRLRRRAETIQATLDNEVSWRTEGSKGVLTFQGNVVLRECNLGDTSTKFPVTSRHR